MAVIKDTKGREWDVVINVLTLGRVRKELNINLLEAIIPDNGLCERLAGDVSELAWVLWLIVQDQAPDGVDDSDFYASLDRDAIDNGLRFILEGVVSFSPSGLRPAYRKVLEAARKVEATTTKRVQQFVDSPNFESLLDTAMTKALGGISPDGSPTKTIGDAGSLPGSVESTLQTTELPAGIASEP